MAITVTPRPTALGAEITGIDLREPLDRAAWLEYLVLVFSDQALEEDDQIRLSEYFGTLGARQRPLDLRAETDEVHPKVMLVSNIRKDGKPIGTLPDGEMMFHSDAIYAEERYSATILFTIEVPSVGGNTLFANLYKAYETLTTGHKERLEGCQAYHHYHYGELVKGDGAGAEVFGEAWHPIFRTHPETRRKAVFVNRLMTETIIRLDKAESDALLAQLFNHCERPNLVYEHVWRPGDLIIWDNRCNNHGRTEFPPEHCSLLRRTTVLGDRPF